VWSTLKCRCSKYSITSKPPGEFRGLAEERVTAMLSSFFAALALFLDSVVLYGLMSYAKCSLARAPRSARFGAVRHSHRHPLCPRRDPPHSLHALRPFSKRSPNHRSRLFATPSRRARIEDTRFADLEQCAADHVTFSDVFMMSRASNDSFSDDPSFP
jgi:hypothetical protein